MHAHANLHHARPLSKPPAGFEHIRRYQDPRGAVIAKLLPGDYYVTTHDELMTLPEADFARMDTLWLQRFQAILDLAQRDDLEAHYLAGGHVQLVVNSLVSADKANLALEMAVLGLKKYREGEAKEQRKTAEIDVKQSEHLLQRAKDYLKDSEELFKEGFITRNKRQDEEFTA